jgi:hypothetical protein
MDADITFRVNTMSAPGTKYNHRNQHEINAEKFHRFQVQILN